MSMDVTISECVNNVTSTDMFNGHPVPVKLLNFVPNYNFF
jgi:hypothetical protein